MHHTARNAPESLKQLCKNPIATVTSPPPGTASRSILHYALQ